MSEIDSYLNCVGLGQRQGRSFLWLLQVALFLGLLALSFRVAAADVIINELLAENLNGLKDEDNQPEDWIELFNRGTSVVNLGDWSLTDDPSTPDQWIFPSVTLAPKAYLVVFASGKDRRSVSPGAKLHTNFKLSSEGEYLGLYNNASPRQAVTEVAPSYPEQRIDYSYGRDGLGQWQYFAVPTPGATNNSGGIREIVAPVSFSVPRSFVSQAFNLTLSCATPGVRIRYTWDGSEPTEVNGLDYSAPLAINQTRIVRAVAFKTNALPSRITTQTYLYNLPATQRALPVVSLVTATNNLYGPTGIIGISGGAYGTDGTWHRVKTNDYYNPSKKGVAWERPVSVELIHPGDNSGFAVSSGIRVHASDYFRPRMHTGDKFSFTLYFRGDYGANRLEYPWFTNCLVTEFNEIVLRAGSNDPINPFLRDELVRRLCADTGEVASHGDFANLFINGKYVKYYNPAERIEKAFCQAWQGGSEAWDVREQAGQMVEGTGANFDSMMTFFNTKAFTSDANYRDATRRLDVTNFVDYLLPLLYADTGDWPENNWRAGRERVALGLWRFYVWDAEWSFGLYNKAASHNPFAEQLAGSSEIATIFKKLKVHPEFRLLFADRAHQHLFNGGALTDDHIRLRYGECKAVIKPVISGFDDSIATVWIPQRRKYFTNYLASAGLLVSANAPVFSRSSGSVVSGATVTMTTTAADGHIYYTVDGSDPRVPFTGAIAGAARLFRPNTTVVLNQSAFLRARTLQGTNWSALTTATFEIGLAAPLVRFTEIMYHPLGGDAFQFIELQNIGTVPVDLSGMSLVGVKFRFPGRFPWLMPGALVVLAADANPAAFAQRYTNVVVAGFFGGNLDNSGERLALLDPTGQVITSVTYKDSAPWPKAADGQGPSLELVNLTGDPNNAVNWRASPASGGSPGAPNPGVTAPSTLLDTDLSLEISPMDSEPGYELRFDAVAGQSYRIEVCDELLGGTWRKLVDIPAGPASSRLAVTDAGAVGRRYYRLTLREP